MKNDQTPNFDSDNQANFKKYPNTPNFQQKQNPRIQNSKSGKIKRTESNKSQKYDINTNEFKKMMRKRLI